MKIQRKDAKIAKEKIQMSTGSVAVFARSTDSPRFFYMETLRSLRFRTFALKKYEAR